MLNNHKVRRSCECEKSDSEQHFLKVYTEALPRSGETVTVQTSGYLSDAIQLLGK